MERPTEFPQRKLIEVNRETYYHIAEARERRRQALITKTEASLAYAVAFAAELDAAHDMAVLRIGPIEFKLKMLKRGEEL